MFTCIDKIFHNNFLFKTIIVCIALVIGICTYTYLGMQPANTIEKAVEIIIKQETGADVDLTPIIK